MENIIMALDFILNTMLIGILKFEIFNFSIILFIILCMIAYKTIKVTIKKIRVIKKSSEP